MKDKIKENIGLLLMVLSAVLVAVILVEFVQFGADMAKANSFVKTAIKDVNNTDEQIAETIKTLKEPADGLKKHSIFFPPPKAEQWPVKNVEGIFGDEAIINGKMYKVGAKIGSVEIIKIDAAEVTIIWKGKEKKFAPIAAAVKDSGVVVKADPNKQNEEKKKQVAKVQENSSEEVVQENDEEDMLAWMEMDLNEDQREKLEYLISNAPEFLLEQLKNQFTNASDEEKQEMLEELDNVSMEMIEQMIQQMQNIDPAMLEQMQKGTVEINN